MARVFIGNDKDGQNIYRERQRCTEYLSGTTKMSILFIGNDTYAHIIYRERQRYPEYLSGTTKMPRVFMFTMHMPVTVGDTTFTMQLLMLGTLTWVTAQESDDI
jgi:hypothetical protein